MLIHLHIVYSCFSIATAALTSSERDVTAQNSKYFLCVSGWEACCQVPHRRFFRLVIHYFLVGTLEVAYLSVCLLLLLLLCLCA